MNDCEIFLSRLADKTDLYCELSKKIGICSDVNDIPKLFDSLPSPLNIKVFVSNENTENAELDNIISCLKTCSENHSFNIEIIKDEFLNIIDSEDRITSESKPRSVIHRDGDIHPTVHIWIIKRADMGIYVLLQKRSSSKDTHPDCYDVSAAGHVIQGSEFRDSAVKELYEELGIKLPPEKLDFIGIQKKNSSENLNGTEIRDNEMSAVYLCNENIKIEDLNINPDEVADVGWAEIDELLSIMKKNDFKHCLITEELFKIKKAVY